MRSTLAALAGLLALSACADTRHFFVRTDDGAHLKVRLRGDRDTDRIVVVLHGGPNGNVLPYTIGDAAEALEQEAAWAYIDQRGMGASQRLGDEADYDFDRAAEDILDVIDVLEARYPEAQLVLYGHSYGGALGTKMLVDTDAADHVAGWIEVAGCHDFLLESSLVEARLREVAAEEIEAGSERADRWQATLDFLDQHDFSVDGIAAMEDASPLVTLNRRGYLAEGWVADHRAREDAPHLGAVESWAGGVRPGVDGSAILEGMGLGYVNFRGSERLGEVDLPAAYLYADYDFVCPTPLGQAAAAANPDGELTIFEASGHSIMFDQTALYIDTVTDFLDRL